MTTKPNNLIYIPSKYDLKVSILVDTRTKQSELKIERGRITNIQLMGMLLEHATNILRNMMMLPPNTLLTGDDNNSTQGNDGGENNAT